ncbi:large ribosomal subunit protein eL29-like [Camelus dromedarius]|uniref:large ribosomal subunit protein eL29-like n=1 Tax=Camelus dromedarius TaxID=9838 RepID=UPI003119FF1E
MLFTKKHTKKGLKKMQANNSKAMSAHAEAVKALGKSSPRSQRATATSSVNLPALLTPSSGNVLMTASPRVSGSVGQRPRLRPRRQLQLQLRLRLPKVPRPPQKLQSRAFHLLM